MLAVGAARGKFQGREWLLPLCGLGMFVYLMVQQQGVMEGRYRKPLDPILVAAAVVMTYRWTRRTRPPADLEPAAEIPPQVSAPDIAAEIPPPASI